jgi:branched-chain amino acid transport system permease protein
MNFLNLAHISFFSLSAFLTASVLAFLANNIASDMLGVLIAIIAITVVIPIMITSVAFGFRISVYGRLKSMEVPYQLLGTFALVFILEDVMKAIWGVASYRTQFVSDNLGALNVAGAAISSVSILTTLIGLTIVGTLYYLFEKTTLGKIITALEENPEVVSTSGINGEKVYQKIFIIGTILASLGGSLWVMNYSITTGLTFDFIILAFVLTVVGGVGSFIGAVIAAVLIGVVRTFSILYVPGVEMIIIYLIMAAVIVVKPGGIGGAISE